MDSFVSEAAKIPILGLCLLSAVNCKSRTFNDAKQSFSERFDESKQSFFEKQAAVNKIVKESKPFDMAAIENAKCAKVFEHSNLSMEDRCKLVVYLQAFKDQKAISIKESKESAQSLRQAEVACFAPSKLTNDWPDAQIKVKPETVQKDRLDKVNVQKMCLSFSLVKFAKVA